MQITFSLSLSKPDTTEQGSLYIGTVTVPEGFDGATLVAYVAGAIAQSAGRLETAKQKAATPAAMPAREAHTGGAGMSRPERQQRPTEWTPEALAALRCGKIVGGFAGPNMTYPLAGTGDIRAAWHASESDPNRERVRWAILQMAATCRWYVPPEFLRRVYK